MTLGNGKPCKKCGTSAWYSGGHCKECQREHGRKWKKNNPEKTRENARRWQKNNPDKVRESDRKWREANPDKVRENGRKWKKNNPDKAREIVREWQKNNPDKVKARDQKRRTRKTKAGGSFTAAEWNGLCEAYQNMCLKCGKTFPRNKLTADHVKPVALGGDSNITNIQPLCSSCNSSKGAKHIDYRKGNVKRWVQRKLTDFLSD